MDSNLRPFVHASYRSLVAAAEAGTLQVLSEGRMRSAVDESDVQAWLVGNPLPSVQEWRKRGPAELAALGGDIG
jgi:hypothetical protein